MQLAAGQPHGYGAPVLDEAPRLATAWEYGAGRVRPKPRPRPRLSAPAEVVVEADLSRPVRPYVFTESYSPGDRLEHQTLGLGVVQGVAGPGKISVLFDETKKVLVHERAGSVGGATTAPPTPATTSLD